MGIENIQAVFENIQAVFENTGKTYQRMLERFRPCKPGSEFLEQNLITIFTHEFLRTFGEEACVYTEIPFMQKKQDREEKAWQARLDGFLIEGNNGYLLEAKGSLSADRLFEAIDLDIDRIDSKRLADSFFTMAREQTLPDNFYGLVIADCWKHERLQDEGSQYSRWNSDGIVDQFPQLAKIERWSMPMGCYDGYQHYLLGGWTGKLAFQGNKV